MTVFDSGDTVSAAVFNQVVKWINLRPAVEYAETVIAAHRGHGGRKPGPITYSLHGVLVAAACLIGEGRTPSLKRIHRVLLVGFTDDQRTKVGIDATTDVVSQLGSSKKERENEYKRFYGWLDRCLRWFDPHFDIPARKITNGEFRRLMAARTEADREAAAAAFDAAHTFVNLIVAGSVRETNPAGYVGDLVADETIYDVAAIRYGDGMRDDLRRSAVPMAAFYRRKDGTVKTGPSAGASRDKMALGIGVTVASRVGAPGSIRCVPPAAVAVSFGPPTSGSVAAVEECIKHASANGLIPKLKQVSANTLGPEQDACDGLIPAPKQDRADGKDAEQEARDRRSRKRAPYFTADMGYNAHRGWADLMYRCGYHPIGRYPEHWNVVSHLEPTRAGDISPGPIQAHGALYCPAALELATPRLARRSSDIRADGGNDRHDERLSRLLPMLMGTNSTLRKAAANPGRPKKDEKRTQVYKIDLVCPAVHGRVRCPLKPDSMITATSDAPTLAPTWDADAKKCCAKSHVSVTLTDRQFAQMQPGLPPGSWEHTFLYEAYRSLTERVFSMLKSPHMSNTQAMNWGPRRDPMMMINISLCIAVTNVHLQWYGAEKVIDSVEERFRQLDKELGRRATRVPART
ncbi:hypothetical protein MLP_51900 [Microlunatus phosphovorus NM-1]|uniref:Uncharacterized protein n=1 Tax=Microlunatus phosphovorus (strain ATCC 700054 / DSM 10555 / JCM 9379 / NBRC 101784 / NCIMB 13414 / VKM Ac-1990 / NM-1) TaxID=1032480 RepID=F5XIG6_MICPN|nr:hypothetical protein [Microlunatus phosphovorus]BAK38204.1 hypothetical protein MLP_51900 [Microlunatus phosphovorus NM-1]